MARLVQIATEDPMPALSASSVPPFPTASATVPNGLDSTHSMESADADLAPTSFRTEPLRLSAARVACSTVVDANPPTNA